MCYTKYIKKGNTMNSSTIIIQNNELYDTISGLLFLNTDRSFNISLIEEQDITIEEYLNGILEDIKNKEIIYVLDLFNIITIMPKGVDLDENIEIYSNWDDIPIENKIKSYQYNIQEYINRIIPLRKKSSMFESTIEEDNILYFYRDKKSDLEYKLKYLLDTENREKFSKDISNLVDDSSVILDKFLKLKNKE